MDSPHTRLIDGLSSSRSGGRRRSVLRAGCSVALAVLSGLACFRLHFNLSTAGSLELLLVVLVALRWGFLQASIASLAATACLNYLFVPPIFQFSVNEPENWVSLLIFVLTALLVSGLAAKVKSAAAQAELQRKHVATLYELSRAVLLLDRRDADGGHLAGLIRELVGVKDVAIWHMYRADGGDERTSAAKAVYMGGSEGDDLMLRTSRRVLRVGTTAMGAVVLSGWDVVPAMADAVASLTALALERARSLEMENRAEAGRQTEQLRTAVLDGLAHGFKTPLTAILTASSGLLAIGPLNAMQTELVGLIDERAGALNKLTTRLLQTASLEAREVRLRPAMFDAGELIAELLATQEEDVRGRIRVAAGDVCVRADRELVGLALAQLIDNAAKYSVPGSLIEVAVRMEDSEVFFSVENAGDGVQMHERERIFDRFFRSADAVHGPAGTGLGLSIVKKVAEAHEGRAWVASENGVTRFTFTIASRTEEMHE